MPHTSRSWLLRDQWAKDSQRRVLRFEALESRSLLTVLTVVNTQDSGPGSLRQAILDANASPDGGTIVFQIPPTDPGHFDVDASIQGGDPQPDAWRIVPLSELPELNHPSAGVTIDGRTQTAIAGNLNPLGPEIILDGNGLAARGLILRTAGHTVAGLNIQRFGNTGIDVLGGDRNVIIGNFIGLDATGTQAAGNLSWGIYLSGGAANNRVGTNGDGINDEAERNVIAASKNDGVGITGPGSDDNVVAGNYLGTNATASGAIGNSLQGVAIWDGPKRNRVGTNADGVDDAAEANIISGNLDDGVGISGVGTTHNVVAGNLIGINAANVPLNNKNYGVVISRGAVQNIIGGSTPAARNVISANTLSGVRITGTATSANRVSGNFIGTDTTGQVALGNGQRGVVIDTGASNNVIGTDSNGDGDLVERNVISGNLDAGVAILGSGTSQNVVTGNYIGLNAIGTASMGNENGVSIFNGATFNTVGTDTDGIRDELEGNIISGNLEEGVRISGAGTKHNAVAGNVIGTTSGNATTVGNGETGVVIYLGASENIVGGGSSAARNVISGNGHNGVRITQEGTKANHVAGNYIGTDISGRSSLGNGHSGILIDLGASNNSIGVNGDGIADEFEGNVISGNVTSGLSINGQGTSGNVVAGNVIGTSASGSQALGNGRYGVAVYNGATSNRIGTDVNGISDAFEANIISANMWAGVSIIDIGTTHNAVAGNFIGTNLALAAGLGNKSHGVSIFDDASSNTVGGTSQAARNVIKDNAGNGVLVQGLATRNAIIGNSFSSNALLAIDLNGLAGTSPNDSGDPDTGPNGNQNAPSLNFATLVGQTLTVGYYIDSAITNSAYPLRVELYKTDSSGQEGQTLLGFAIYQAVDATKIRRLALFPASIIQGGDRIVATATDSDGNTSEFSVESILVNVVKNPWHNDALTLDVSGDGHEVAGDALEVINRLNAFGSGPVPFDAPVGAPYYDTSNDGHVSPIDALNIINAINAGLAQAEPSTANTLSVRTESATVDAALLAFLLTDVPQPGKSRKIA